MKLTINKNEYDLRLTFKGLAELGFVKDDFRKNGETYTKTLSNVILGDILSLPEILKVLTNKKLETIEKDLENAENIEEIMQFIEDFFEKAPLLASYNKLMLGQIRKVKEQIQVEMNREENDTAH